MLGQGVSNILIKFFPIIANPRFTQGDSDPGHIGHRAAFVTYSDPGFTKIALSQQVHDGFGVNTLSKKRIRAIPKFLP